MSDAAKLNDDYYLTNNLDVVLAIELGSFEDSLEHFDLFGGIELRAPNALFSPIYYISQNPDVIEAISQGFFRNIFEHYQLF